VAVRKSCLAGGARRIWGFYRSERPWEAETRVLIRLGPVGFCPLRKGNVGQTPARIFLDFLSCVGR
jgi:hypothetical protein